MVSGLRILEPIASWPAVSKAPGTVYTSTGDVVVLESS